MANKVPTPPNDPRYSSDLGYGYRPGNEQKVYDHPDYSKPDDDGHVERLKSMMNSMGEKSVYSVSTKQMGDAVTVSESVPRRKD